MLSLKHKRSDVLVRVLLSIEDIAKDLLPKNSLHLTSRPPLQFTWLPWFSFSLGGGRDGPVYKGYPSSGAPHFKRRFLHCLDVRRTTGR